MAWPFGSTRVFPCLPCACTADPEGLLGATMGLFRTGRAAAAASCSCRACAAACGMLIISALGWQLHAVCKSKGTLDGQLRCVVLQKQKRTEMVSCRGAMLISCFWPAPLPASSAGGSSTFSTLSVGHAPCNSPHVAACQQNEICITPEGQACLHALVAQRWGLTNAILCWSSSSSVRGCASLQVCSVIILRSLLQVCELLPCIVWVPAA